MKKKPRFASRFAQISLIGLLLVLIGVSLYVSAAPKVTVSSTVYHSLSTYQSEATDQIGGLADRSKISFNANQLILSLKKKFPEISDVSVELPLFSSHPIVHIQVGEPEFILASGASKFILNSQGVAVAAPAILAAKSQLLTLQDQGHFKLTSGSQALSSDQLNFIGQVISQLHNSKVSIASLILPPAAEELDLHPAGVNYYVKFFLGGDPLVEAGQYLAARKHFIVTNVQPSQYVDVRVAGKIFYK